VDHPDQLLEDLLLRAGRRTRHQEALAVPAGLAVGFHPMCGSELTISFFEEGGLIAKIEYTTSGCPYARASCLVLAESGPGRTRQELLAWVGEIMMHFQKPLCDATAESITDDLGILLSARRIIHRLPCLTLPWETLAAALTPERRDPASM
jgi:NifU-like protein involved in Fe-S cluster formation